MKKFFYLKLFLLLLLGGGLIVTSTGCNFITPGQRQLLDPIQLSWWGVVDNPTDFDQLIADYQTIHPNISIKYRKLRAEEFEKELIDALAEDRGPDIFSIRNGWVDQYLTKIAPMPPTTRLAYQITRKSLGIKEETLVDVRETPSLTEGQLKNLFIDVVADDVVRGGNIYGLPLSVDPLVMYYNRDLFNNAGLPLPPNNWLQFQEYVQRLTFQNTQGQLIQAGAALGLASNVENYFDLISLLMLQNGAEMTIGNRATFPFVPSGGDRSYNPGPEAVRFYTDFANPAKEVYTWNNTFPESLDAFAAGNVAMFFGYQADRAELEAKRQGKLNYDVAHIPQIEGRPETNFANYWVHTVSKKSPYANEAWDFLQFITKATEAQKYLERTGHPTALRSLIENQTSNDQLRVFAEQLLTSKSWYHGKNFTAAQNAFAEMVTAVLTDGLSPEKATELAGQKIQQTL